MLKKSDITIPKDTPENDGVLMFLWRKGSKDKGGLDPSITWEGMDTNKFGDAFQLLVTHLLETDFRNFIISYKMLVDIGRELYPEEIKKLEEQFDERLQRDKEEKDESGPNEKAG